MDPTEKAIKALIKWLSENGRSYLTKIMSEVEVFEDKYFFHFNFLGQKFTVMYDATTEKLYKKDGEKFFSLFNLTDPNILRKED